MIILKGTRFNWF